MVTNNRLGFWSAVTLAAIGVIYIVTLGVGFARHGLQEPIRDPVLAVMEGLTLISALPIVILMAAVAARAADCRKTFGLAALAFGALCAGVTSTVHFVELTAVRQLGGGGIEWPSPAYAAELLAWDVFLGLAFIFAAPVFDRPKGDGAVRWSLTVCGVLCLVGAVGPAVGNMRVQLIGVLGYAVVLPVVCVLLARVFSHDDHQNTEAVAQQSQAGDVPKAAP